MGGEDAAGKIPANFEAEVKQSLDNINAVLKEAGMALSDVVSVQVYLTDGELFNRMNTVYKTTFRCRPLAPLSWSPSSLARDISRSPRPPENRQRAASTARSQKRNARAPRPKTTATCATFCVEGRAERVSARAGSAYRRRAARYGVRRAAPSNLRRETCRRGPPTHFPAVGFPCHAPPIGQNRSRQQPYSRCRTVKGLTRDCHVNSRGALMRPIVL